MSVPELLVTPCAEMTNDEIPNDERMTNDECRMEETDDGGFSSRGETCMPRHDQLGVYSETFKAQFFVIRHSSFRLRHDQLRVYGETSKARPLKAFRDRVEESCREILLAQRTQTVLTPVGSEQDVLAGDGTDRVGRVPDDPVQFLPP